MKKPLFPIALLLMVAVACHPKDPNEVEVETYTLDDSVFHENEFAEGFSYFSMNLDLPVTKNKTLRQNILKWMLSNETEDPEAYLLAMKDNFLENEGVEPKSEYEENYTLSEQTDRYVTYINEGFVYTGGAHEMPWYNGTTFSKIDGSIVGYDLFEDPEQLLGLISENVEKQYFANMEEGIGFTEHANVTELPTNEPWIETDSVVFCFEPNEIADYAAGMPLCKIAKEDLWPYLSEKGKAFFQAQ